MRHSIASLVVVSLLAMPAAGQLRSLPPSGENQRSTVSQQIGPVNVSIDYASPDVHGPQGEDRRGKIWGTLVPYGTIDEDFGTCSECPWRAGANFNTTFTTSHDVKIEGQPLAAGTYGLHMIAGADEFTVIFSKDATSWGSYFYEPKNDALRVKVKPAKSDYHEWLTYDFIDRRPAKATVALKWEDLQIPFTISVDDPVSLNIAALQRELRNNTGFSSANWLAAAQYALSVNRPQDALAFADGAVNLRFIGEQNFRTLNTLATAQEAAGLAAEAKATRERAMTHPSATALDLHAYGRQLLTTGKKEEALRIWEANAKRHPNAWPVHVGLARGYSAVGRYKDALKHAKLALAQAPDDVNKRSLEAGIKKLEAGQDMNQ